MEEQTETTNEPTSTETTEDTETTTDNPTLENNEANDPTTQTPGGDAELLGAEGTSITSEELEELLKEYTNTKSDVTVLVDEESGREAIVQVVHSVTLGDIYIMVLLVILIITTLLSRLIGRR